MPCSTAVKLPPTTTWPSVGLLCLCSCTLPLFVGEEDEGTGTSTIAATESGASSATDADPATDSEAAGAATADASASGSSEGATSDPRLDVGTYDVGPSCEAPDIACDVDSESVEHALGLNCDGGGITTQGPPALAGAPGTWKVVAGLGEGSSFAPRLGARALLLSTGDADHVLLTPQELIAQTECSQIGLPCPSTDFPVEFDLELLPAPLDPLAITCLPGQVPPGPGDCSQTVDEQWLGDEPRVAHDYTELRLAAVAPAGATHVALEVAFLTAEYPPRFPTGFNDLAIVWLESEQWTGNIAVHPTLQLPLAADALQDDYDHSGLDPELAGFAFAEHGATDWMELAAQVQSGETITLVIALFDVGDGQVDSALLIDDLHWECAGPTLGGTYP